MNKLNFISTVHMNNDGTVSFWIWDKRTKEYVETNDLDTKVKKVLLDNDFIDNTLGSTWKGVKISEEKLIELGKRLKANRWKWNSAKKDWQYSVTRMDNAVTIMTNSIMKLKRDDNE